MWCEGLDLEDWEDKYEDEVKKENKKNYLHGYCDE